MEILLVLVFGFVLLLIVSCFLGALIGLPILIYDVKQKRRKMEAEEAARKRDKP